MSCAIGWQLFWSSPPDLYSEGRRPTESKRLPSTASGNVVAVGANAATNTAAKHRIAAIRRTVEPLLQIEIIH